jgi:hypothetical protein
MYPPSDLNIVNFDDTVIQTVALKSIKGVKIVPSMVRIGLYPDILTEESVDVPISAVNMPQGKVLRTFPSKVSVRFTVGASMFRMIKPEQFKVIADYNDLTAHPSDKCNIYLRVYPHNVTKGPFGYEQGGLSDRTAMRIAITGGIGSGKSYVCQLLLKHGIKVYDCDEAAKRLMRTSLSLQHQLMQLGG